MEKIKRGFQKYVDSRWEVKLGVASEFLALISIALPILAKDPAYGMCPSTLGMMGAVLFMKGYKENIKIN